ncbi:hypothetical protein D3C76_1669130 [compost metagenome]
MTINKKDARTIVVNEEVFKWTISPDSGYAVFVAESGIKKGSRIEVIIPSECSDYWTSFPNVGDLNMRVVKPADAARFIAQAIELGWEPLKSSEPMVFDLVGEVLILRK